MTEPRSIFQPLPGRECGACTVCCVELAIDDPALTKPEGVACPHRLGEDGGCGIHAVRPATCATWFCGWRLLKLSDAMRPDRSKVLMIPEMCREPGYEKGGLALTPVGEDAGVLLQDEVVDLAGRCVAGGVPIFLAYGAGVACRRVLINPSTEAAVRAGDRAGFVRALGAMLEALAG